ncbi:MAG: hypothetical protein E7I21_09710 [Limosilactobacillus fermentum]|nr:hypothetical protein [Limosilactobacillus fermentum]
MSKKVWRWLLLIVALIAIGGGAAWYLRGEPSLVANQEQQRILKKKILLVALGDSLTHGQGVTWGKLRPAWKISMATR